MLELLVLLATASPEAAQAPVQTAQVQDAARCQRLAAYYDRYAQRGEGSLRNGAFDRAIGGDYCRQGRIKDGEALLEKAIAALGFEPPK
ncbi:MAG: hypothetical protein ABI439_12040 [Rhodospirillales bacterium]